MNIGFIGSGNMANAIISGILNQQFVESSSIYISDSNLEKLEKLKSEFDIRACISNVDLVKKSDIIFLAVKPIHYPSVMENIKDVLEDKIFVSLAPGKDIAYLEHYLGSSKKILRTMPNTPSMVNSGVTAICANSNITKKEISYLKDLLSTFSLVKEVEERLFDVIVAVAGSSPAYIFMIIEAMADAAVLGGLDREMAYELAAGAVMGSAKMVLETKRHPAELKDMVTSPEGTTIEALRMLEKGNLRSTLIEAMIAAYNKSKSM